VTASNRDTASERRRRNSAVATSAPTTTADNAKALAVRMCRQYLLIA